MSAYNDFDIIQFKEGDLALDRRFYQYRPSRGDKHHTVIEDERLDTIAFKYYRDSTLWYLIADVNEIFNPLAKLVPGTELLIPAAI